MEAQPGEGGHFVASWPIVRYTSNGDLFTRMLFLTAHELVLVNPENGRITAHNCLLDVSKVSWDRASDKLFRVVFNNSDVHIYLSRDRNDVINSIVSCLKFATNGNLHRTAPAGAPFPGSDARLPFPPLPAGLVDMQSGYYEYQVFGIDLQRRLHPHLLGLASHFIKHIDTATSKSFSQHTYDDVRDVLVDTENNTTKVTIVYHADNCYKFIVSDNDRAELLALLKGRMHIYRLFRNSNPTDIIPLGDFDDADMRSQQDEDHAFPDKFSLVTESFAAYNKPADGASIALARVQQTDEQAPRQKRGLFGLFRKKKKKGRRAEAQSH